MTDLSINQILGIVELAGRQEMNHLFLIGIVAVFTAAATVAGAYGIYLLYRNGRRSGHSVLSSLFFAAYALCVAFAGNDSNKPTPTPEATIVFDTSLYDDGSVATNDCPTIRWTYDPWIANDVLHIEARPKGSTNETDWIQYYVGRVTDASWTGYIPACTGMTICVWSEYVQPSPVSTNGVYHLEYLSVPLDYVQDAGDLRMWDLLRTPIYDADEKRLMSPPSLTEPLVIEIPNELLNSFLNNEPENQDEN